MAVRLRDIAEELGVSQATVSLALSGNARISEATRERIISTATERGYRPNAAALALKTDKTKTICLIVSDVANPFFGQLAGQIERRAAIEGYSVLLCNSDEEASRQDRYISQALAGGQADGILLVPVSPLTSAIQNAGASPSNLVLLDHLPQHIDSLGEPEGQSAFRLVRSDSVQAITDAAKLLVDFGHTRIAILSPPGGIERRENIKSSLIEQGAPEEGILSEEVDFRDGTEGERVVRRLLARDDRPTALFAVHGMIALTAMKAIKASNLRIPAEISLVSFDDAPWFELLDPPLTTIEQPIDAIAEAAVTAMLCVINGKSPDQVDLTPTSRLVVRSSCGIAPSQNLAPR